MQSRTQCIMCLFMFKLLIYCVVYIIYFLFIFRTLTTISLAMASSVISFYFLCILCKVEHNIQHVFFFLFIHFVRFPIYFVIFCCMYFLTLTTNLSGDGVRHDDFTSLPFPSLHFSSFLFLIRLFNSSPWRRSLWRWRPAWHQFIWFLMYFMQRRWQQTNVYLTLFLVLFCFVLFYFIWFLIYLFPYPDDHLSSDGVHEINLFIYFMFCYIFWYLFISLPWRPSVWR
jgi:hypothetical protein